MQQLFFALAVQVLLVPSMEGFTACPGRVTPARRVASPVAARNLVRLDAAGGEKDPRAYLRGSEFRGAVLLGLVLLVNVWLFSIPPEFRRAEICLRESASDCVKLQDWASQIKAYYDAGGGVVFDFSIERK